MGFPGEEILSGLIGGGATLASNAQQIQAQQLAAERAMKFSHDEAANQMAFQERMSSTAHQREMQDLKTAGLNPILAAGGGGASSPGGAAGSGEVAQTKGLMEGVVSSAKEMGLLKLNADVLRGQKKLIDSNIESQDIKNGRERAIKPFWDKLGQVIKQSVNDPAGTFAKFLEGHWVKDYLFPDTILPANKGGDSKGGGGY